MKRSIRRARVRIVNWQRYITADSAVLVGKPVIKGTRLSVEFILDLMVQGWSEEEILRNYRYVEREQVRACVACAQARLSEEKVFLAGGLNQATLRQREVRILGITYGLGRPLQRGGGVLRSDAPVAQMTWEGSDTRPGPSSSARVADQRVLRATKPTKVPTVKRVPRMHGFPPITPGSTDSRSQSGKFMGANCQCPAALSR